MAGADGRAGVGDGGRTTGRGDYDGADDRADDKMGQTRGLRRVGQGVEQSERWSRGGRGAEWWAEQQGIGVG